MFFGPHLLEADDGRCRQTWRVADEGRQHFLEVAGRDSLQVEDWDQHLKALRSPRVSRQDRWRVSDALAIARCTVAHPRLANGDRADAGHDVALWKMAMAYHALMARLGLEIRMLCEKLSNLRLDRLGQQRTRAPAQKLCQGVGEDPWLGELDDVIVGHGVSFLHWRSGGVEHHHDTPPHPVSPSPTSGHSSQRSHDETAGRRNRICQRRGGPLGQLPPLLSGLPARSLRLDRVFVQKGQLPFPTMPPSLTRRKLGYHERLECTSCVRVNHVFLCDPRASEVR